MTLEKINHINDIMIGVLKVAYLNLLWILTVIISLGTFTVGPATYGMLKYYDQWLRCKKELPVGKTFFNYVRENFKNTLIVGLIFEFGIVVVVVNLFSLNSWILQIINLLVLILILSTITHTFSLMFLMNYKSKRDNIVAGFLLGVGYPHYTIICWTVIIGFYLIMSKYFPAVVFLFGVGFTGLALSITNRLVEKQVQKLIKI